MDQLKEKLTTHKTTALAPFKGDNFTVKAQASGYASSFETTVWQGNAGMTYAGQVYRTRERMKVPMAKICIPQDRGTL